MPTPLSTPLKAAEIRSRVEPDLKENATRILAACGLNVSDAVRLFLRQVVAHNGLPFEVKAPMPRFGSVQELPTSASSHGSARPATRSQA